MIRKSVKIDINQFFLPTIYRAVGKTVYIHIPYEYSLRFLFLNYFHMVKEPINIYNLVIIMV